VSAADKDFIKATKIYAKETPVSLLTHTNELAEWIDYNEDDCFIPMQFALKLDGEVVGYSLVAYLKETKVVMLDYISLRSNFRLNTIFLAFVNLLQTFVKDKYVCTYFAVQVSNKNEGKEIDKDSLLFKKLLCLEGFRKVEYEYINTPFDADAPETIYEAFLYIQSNDIVHSMLRENYLQIVKSLKNYHYQWAVKVYRCKDKLSDYEKILSNWYNEIEQKNIDIERQVTAISCPLLDNFKHQTYGYIPPASKDKKKKILLIMFVIMFVALPIPIIASYNAILNSLNIPISEVSSIIGALISAGIAAIFTFLIYYQTNKKL